MEKENRWCGTAHGSSEAGAELGRISPTPGGGAKHHHCTDRRVTCSQEERQRTAEGVADHGQAVAVHVRDRPKELQPCDGIVQFCSVQQCQLDPIALRLPTSSESPGHEFPTGGVLVGREPDAAPKEQEEGIPVLRKMRA
jgi:hypothetical protein